jgi:outer membrane protein
MSLRRSTIASMAALVLASAMLAAGARASDALPSPLTLTQAIDFALAHHPALRAASAAEQEAGANLDLAQSRLLPQGDIGLQENRATGNVVPGTHFTMTDIPPISGPPTDRVFNSGEWGSTAGVSLSWDIAHLSEKMALADAAMAERLSAQSQAQAQTVEVAFRAANSFALVVEAGEQVKAARASLHRATVFETTVDALVNSGLRPGADGARAAAETALAQTELIRAQEAQSLSEVQLSQALGAAGQSVEVAAGALAREQPPRDVKSGNPARNPLIVAADRAHSAAADRARAARLEYIPRVEVVAALFGRANGLFPGGMNLGSAQGLVPDTPNWGAGVVMTIPILQYPEIRARAELAAAAAKRELARRDEVAQEVQSQVDSAAAIVDSSYRIAAQARISKASSRAALTQAQARYRAGLYGIDPVAEALRLLARAEAEDAVARVDIWRAQLLRARAIGDLGPLLSEVNQASGGR